MEQLEVWEETPDQWRWSYRGGPDIELVSNLVYEDRAEAERAARHAYPDVDLEVEPEAESTDRRWLFVLVLLVLAAIGIGILAGRSRTEQEDE